MVNRQLMDNKALIVIPARMGSSRYPGKPMAKVKGITMIERVWNIAQRCKFASAVVIATEDPNLKNYVESFGAQAIITSPNCKSGTDRVAQAYQQQAQTFQVIINLQGDAVLTPAHIIDELIDIMLTQPTLSIATPAIKLTGQALHDFVQQKQAGSTTGTCVVFDQSMHALYFSKSLLPFYRDGIPAIDRQIYKHIGIYAYCPEILLKLTQLSEGQLEKVEKLEQLRALENNIPIKIVPVKISDQTLGSIDRPEDVLLIERIIEQQGELK
jgi:3-deoxy-manno-octulosonate cytidylyltransferase (CMP-KDO synthetase)